jgi:hypothetical protein
VLRCGGVDDFTVEVVGQEQDAGSGVDASDADVVEPSVDSQGDAAGVADALVADTVVGTHAAGRAHADDPSAQRLPVAM